MLLTRHTCSSCLYWSEIRFADKDIMKARCEKSDKHTGGGENCGHWKKVKWTYNYVYDRMEKEYK